eukprot:4407720-Prymnesium_polylepis.1
MKEAAEGLPARSGLLRLAAIGRLRSGQERDAFLQSTKARQPFGDEKLCCVRGEPSEHHCHGAHFLLLLGDMVDMVAVDIDVRI